ncbi:MAG: hypothetical protein GY780_02205 [bacterium]|nr:hypothetical protein [bacterium]
MSKKSSITICLIGFMLLANGVAFSWPDLDASSVRMPNIGEEIPVIFVVPNGTGTPLTEARAFGTWELVDATIEVTLIDHTGQPMTNVPQIELSLGTPEGSFSTCYLSGLPEEATNSDGVTYWSSSLEATGSNNGQVHVLLNYTPITGDGSPLNIFVNSGDMNWDGYITLADVSLFAGFFFGDYDLSADLFPDGTLSLADVSRLAQGMAASCP